MVSGVERCHWLLFEVSLRLEGRMKSMLFGFFDSVSTLLCLSFKM